MYYETEPMSNFVIKVFTKSDVFKRTIPRSEIDGDISFTNKLNNGFGELSLRLVGRDETQDTDGSFIQNLWLIHWDIIKVIDPEQNIVTDHWAYKSVADTPIYAGVVVEVHRVIKERWTYHVVDCLGIQTVLNTLLYEYSASTSFTRTADASDILKEILDLFPDYFSYTGWSIPAYWTSVQIEFDNVSCLTAVKKIIDVTGRWVRYDGDWVVYFFERTVTTTDHVLNYKDHLKSIVHREDSTDIVNDLTVSYDWGVVTASDATSQTTYGVRQGYITSSDIKDSTTADEYADTYIAEHKDPKPKIELTVNPTYDFATLKAGQTVRIQWDPTGIGTKYIEKIAFTGEQCTLWLYESESLEGSLYRMFWF